MDVGLLIIRVVVGLVFAGHGLQKLFGWFGGPGIQRATGMVESLRYPGGRTTATLHGLTETGSGLLLALGLLTPLAAAGIIGVMLNAIVTVHWAKGLWNTNGGYEFPLALSAAAAGVAFIGPGAWSVDAAIGWGLAGIGWGLAALGTGLGVGGLALALRKPVAAAAQGSQQRPAA